MSELPEIESYETDKMTCPYYRHVPGGICLSGCREEPACMTDEPIDGWRARDRRGRYVALTTEQLDAMARRRWADYVVAHNINPDDRPRLSFEQEHFGRDSTCRGVYQAFDGRWFAYDFEGTFQTMRSRAYDTEIEARRVLLDRYLFGDRHGWEMWAWMNAGDRAPRDGVLTRQQQAIVGGIPTKVHRERNVLRVNGVHYIPRCIDRKSGNPFRGFGGRMFRWRWLDEPEGVVHFSDDVMTQGDVPAMMRHLLPDNAVFVQEGA